MNYSSQPPVWTSGLETTPTMIMRRWETLLLFYSSWGGVRGQVRVRYFSIKSCLSLSPVRPVCSQVSIGQINPATHPRAPGGVACCCLQGVQPCLPPHFFLFQLIKKRHKRNHIYQTCKPENRITLLRFLRTKTKLGFKKKKCPVSLFITFLCFLGIVVWLEIK